MRILIAIFILMNVSSAMAKESFVSSKASEAIVEFSGALKYRFNNEPTQKEIKRAIDYQLLYMVGPMSTSSIPGVPKGDHEITNIKILKKRTELYTISYRYKGTAVLMNSTDSSYDIILPFDPKMIYRYSLSGKDNFCTDPVYKTEGAFWYFWNPYRSGCKLREDEHYYIAKAKITRIPNTIETYPEYQNLPDEKGDISIHIFFGMNKTTAARNPLKSSDINAVNYRDFRTYLLKKGYTSQIWNAEMIGQIAKRTNDTQWPFVETLKKGKIEYRLFFGPTGSAEGSLAFYWFYKDAIEHASVMFYAGHSGLGRRLVLETIEDMLGEKIHFNKSRYQIFFFNGCTSYRYYSNMYFQRKKNQNDPKGTKKLDIMSTGLFTYFDYMNVPNKIFAEVIEKAIRSGSTGLGFISYQTMARSMDTNNLFTISGDDDNALPTSIYH